MLEILQEVDMLELYGDKAENFKTSYRWIVAFLKRYKLAHDDAQEFLKSSQVKLKNY